MRARTLTAFCLLLGVAVPPAEAPAATQTRAEVLFQLYEASILYPELFDDYLANHGDRLDQGFFGHLAGVQTRLWAQAAQEINVCDQHVNPEWRSQCVQERPAAGLYFWTVSLQTAVTEATPWAQTWSGSIILFAKRQIEIVGLDYQGLMRPALEMMKPYILLTFQ